MADDKQIVHIESLRNILLEKWEQDPEFNRKSALLSDAQNRMFAVAAIIDCEIERLQTAYKTDPYGRREMKEYSVALIDEDAVPGVSIVTTVKAFDDTIATYLFVLDFTSSVEEEYYWDVEDFMTHLAGSVGDVLEIESVMREFRAYSLHPYHILPMPDSVLSF